MNVYTPTLSILEMLQFTAINDTEKIISTPKSVHVNQNDNRSAVFHILGAKNVIQLHFYYKLLFDCSTNVFMLSIQDFRLSFRY